MKKDYLANKGMCPTKWRHAECGAPIYPTTSSDMGQCGHCAKLIGIPDLDEGNKREYFCLTKLADEYIDSWEMHYSFNSYEEAYIHGIYDFSDWLKQKMRCSDSKEDHSVDANGMINKEPHKFRASCYCDKCNEMVEEEIKMLGSPWKPDPFVEYGGKIRINNVSKTPNPNTSIDNMSQKD